jgi:hypothetical protein
VIAVLALGSLGISHTAAMPAPEDEQRLGRAAATLVGGTSGPTYLHIIDPACSCTARLLEQLVARGAFAEVREIIVFTGDDSRVRVQAEREGFTYLPMTRDALGARLGLEVAPVLIALDADGALRYLGGYFDKPAALHSLDSGIHAGLVAGTAVESLPVYGCAVSDRLRQRLDPLGVVYSAQ